MVAERLANQRALRPSASQAFEAMDF